MKTQPKALRLADALDERRVTRWVHATVETPQASGYSVDAECAQAAAELRRLHQSEREGWRYAKELEHERKELSALLRQALEALEARAVNDYFIEHIYAAITALRERLGEKA